jgi:hypothetical protein
VTPFRLIPTRKISLDPVTVSTCENIKGIEPEKVLTVINMTNIAIIAFLSTSKFAGR